MDTKREFGPFRDMMDDEELPSAGWRILSTVDGDGQLIIKIKVSGGPSIPESLAALEYSKLTVAFPHLLHMFVDAEEYEGDDDL